MNIGLSLAVFAAIAAASACTSPAEERVVPDAPQPWQSEFSVERSELESRGSNTFFVLEPGYQLVYSGKEDGKVVDLVITVLDQTQLIDGVDTRVVEERESQAGELVEV